MFRGLCQIPCIRVMLQRAPCWHSLFDSLLVLLVPLWQPAPFVSPSLVVQLQDGRNLFHTCDCALRRKSATGREFAHLSYHVPLPTARHCFHSGLDRSAAHATYPKHSCAPPVAVPAHLPCLGIQHNTSGTIGIWMEIHACTVQCEVTCEDTLKIICRA